MKRSNLTFVFFLTVLSLSAQDYLVTFSGTGESTTVSTVVVENMTQGKSLTLNGNDILHLKNMVTEISDLAFNNTEGIQFYPNPMKEFSVMEFAMPDEGVAKIELFDISGRKLAQTQSFLNQGRHSYRITGVSNGINVLKVTTSNYSYSGKLISDKRTGEIVNITYQSTIPINGNLTDTKSAKSEVLMQYKTGDVLKFIATSGKNKSVKVEVISQSKNIEIPFYKCADKDNKNYATVQIGSQVWMAENLAYLPAIYPPTSSSFDEPRYYVYGYTGSDGATAKQQPNYATYGVLYNWPAAEAACPPDWHLPSNAEWNVLVNYLISNGYNYNGKTTENLVAKSLAATTNWNIYYGAGAIGNNLSLNNKSGFSALPGGHLNSGYFFDCGDSGNWWSSTEYYSSPTVYYTDYAWNWGFGYDYSKIGQNPVVKNLGFSVRCVMD